MLSPEVSDFKAPEYSFHTNRGIFTDNDEHPAWDRIKAHHFNHLVSVIVPTDVNTTATFANTLDNCEFYKVSEFNPNEFVKTHFIQSFINCGKLIALSVGTRIDTDDCFAVTSTHHLVLSLNKDTYQSLGIEGRPSAFHRGSKAKYFVEIDLKTLNLGSKTHKRILDCLGKLRFDIILNWTPPNDSETPICPSSIAKWFSDEKYNVTLCEPNSETKTIRNVNVPNIPEDNEDVAEYMEWCGMIAMGGDVSVGAFDNYITTYETPEPNELAEQVAVFVSRGFFASENIDELLTTLRKSRSKQFPWAVVYVQGFSDSPINWGRNEHHYYVNGDSGYLVVLTDSKYTLTEFRCSNKRYQKSLK